MRHVLVRHGDMTSVRDVVLVTLFLTLCCSNSLRIDHLALNMTNSTFSLKF